MKQGLTFGLGGMEKDGVGRKGGIKQGLNCLGSGTVVGCGNRWGRKERGYGPRACVGCGTAVGVEAGGARKKGGMIL